MNIREKEKEEFEKKGEEINFWWVRVLGIYTSVSCVFLWYKYVSVFMHAGLLA